MATNPPSELFIVGVPRSGTTILLNLLRHTPDVAWVTPATNAMTGFAAERGIPLSWTFPLARPLDAASKPLPRRWRPRFLKGPRGGKLAGDPLVVADEGSRIWGWHVPDHDHDRLRAEDVTTEARAFYHEVADRHRRRFSSSTFLSKRPANTLRVSFLDELFPEARFVHLVREPHAVGASIVAYYREFGRWWGAKPPGWREQTERPMGACAGWQIRQILATLRADVRERQLGERFVELTYEDLTEQPEATLERLYEEVGLGVDQLEPVRGFLDQLENRNAGWEDRLTDEQVEDLSRELADLETQPPLPEGAVRI